MATPVIRKTARRRAPKPEKSWTASDGQVITEAAAAALAASCESEDNDFADAEPVRVGRAALSPRAAPGEHSPRVSVRLREDAYRALHARAAAEHRRVSDLAREAIEAYVDRAGR